jgi:RNA polymerase sigma-70 factor (ECF subfamily)
MRLVQAGLRNAFVVLVERYAERVASLCRRFAKNGHQGEELAQDTWVSVWKNRDRYQPNLGFHSWLLTIALNRCRNEARRPKLFASGTSENEQLASASVIDDSPAQLDCLLTEERQRRVREALDQLSPPMREALILRFAEELRYEEMTAVLGVGESTLRSRVHHGLKLLKQKLEADS